MDRSFLLQKDVIEASRDFVCIRLATYENKAEADYLVQVFRGRLGTLENTVFAVMSPDARKYLARPGRAPNFAYRDAGEMAAQMQKLAKEYAAAAGERALPAMKDLRLAINTAACDNMPLIVPVGADAPSRERMRHALARIAPDLDANLLIERLQAGLSGFKPPAKEAMTHIREGNRAGVWWKTAIPATDPGPPR